MQSNMPDYPKDLNPSNDSSVRNVTRTAATLWQSMKGKVITVCVQWVMLLNLLIVEVFKADPSHDNTDILRDSVEQIHH